MPTEEHTPTRPHQGVAQRVLALMPPLKILATTVGAALVVCGLLFACLSSPAWAADMTVETTADEQNTNTECSLREAIINANADDQSGSSDCAQGFEDDVINFALPGTAPWTVDLSTALPDLTTNIELVGSGADQLTVRRADTAELFRIFTVSGDTTEVTISGMTISNGNVSSGIGGGGILNNGGTLTISDSTISGNSANQGGGIFNQGGTLTITSSTISDNSANIGGGVFSNTDLSGPKTTITNSTISGNTALLRGGGVINFDGLTEIEHSTITNNSAPSGFGSGVASIASTLTRTEVLSTIISANEGTDVDVGATTNSFVSRGYNLIGDGNATGAFGQPGDLPNENDPGLDPLGSYGGPTQTHRLQSDSLALDAGTNTDCPETDQRGVERPQDGDADSTPTCDIGSFELEEPDNQAPTVRVARGGKCGPVSDMRGTINLALSDPDIPAQDLTLTATSSNRDVVPNGAISFGGGTDASRTMTIERLTGTGTSTLRVRATDGQLRSDPIAVEVTSGTSANNTLLGTPNADMIFARKGSDSLNGRGANDLLCGGNGKDALRGGLGADRFGGGQGIDTARDYNAALGDTKAGIENF